jgi:hypothetical protein
LKKSTLLKAFGEDEGAEKTEAPEDEADLDDAAEPEENDDAAIDDAIDLALDPETPAPQRREAFRRAVKGAL